MIKFIDNKTFANKDNFLGFFADWPKPPSQEKQLKMIFNSTEVIFAINEETNLIIGFINAITDKTMYSFIPLLEVLQEYKNKGIGKELISKMESKLSSMYAIDLCCDQELEGYYKMSGYNKISGMIKR